MYLSFSNERSIARLKAPLSTFSINRLRSPNCLDQSRPLTLPSIINASSLTASNSTPTDRNSIFCFKKFTTF